MKKHLLLAILMLLPLLASGQTKRTINVETAGTLPTLISDEEKYTIEELTLTGELNGTDFRLLRDMAGNNYLGNLTNGKLKVLDLSGTVVKSGGLKYLETKDIRYWKELIRWLPESWLQTRTWTTNYETLRIIYFDRRNHKLSEWNKFCNGWISKLPYAEELIMLEEK
jgi:hypothetical protein